MPSLSKDGSSHIYHADWGTAASMIENGFPEGDDAFDTVVGLFGMVEVVAGRRQAGEPRGNRIRKLEGWILGQSV